MNDTRIVSYLRRKKNLVKYRNKFYFYLRYVSSLSICVLFSYAGIIVYSYLTQLLFDKTPSAIVNHTNGIGWERNQVLYASQVAYN